MRFLDRADAGRRLANLLRPYAYLSDVIVLGIPRGGVPVAYQVAAELDAPLDVFVVRKLGVPWQPELALGAIAGGGVQVIDAEIVESVGISRAEIDRIAAAENQELQRRERIFRGTRPQLHLAGKTVILVDDGIATGASTRAAITALREFRPGRIVLAAPVAPASTCKRLQPEVDDLVCLYTPEMFYAIGEFYDDFTQVSEAEVTELLRLNREQRTERISATSENVRKGAHP